MLFAEMFFDGIIIDGEAAYFTASCDQVTEDVKEQVATSFLNMLRTKGIILIYDTIILAPVIGCFLSLIKLSVLQ